MAMPMSDLLLFLMIFEWTYSLPASELLFLLGSHTRPLRELVMILIECVCQVLCEGMMCHLCWTDEAAQTLRG